MPFNCSLIDGENPISLLVGNGEFIVSLEVGTDSATGGIYSLVVALSPLVGQPHGWYEMVFPIVESTIDGDEIYRWWDGGATRHFISEGNHRSLILGAICGATHHLIDEVVPDVVTITTHTPHLPDKALAKFERICAVFRSHGYEAGLSDPYHGHHIWMMKLNSGLAV